MEVVCHADRGEVFPPFIAKYCCYFVYYVRISVLYIIKRNCNIKCRIKVDTSVTCRDMQQPSCVIFGMRNVKY